MVNEKVVLVTGASGFLAGHIIQCFLSAGYRVRGTVRSESSSEKAHAIHRTPNFEALILSDPLSASSYKSALAGVDGVIHTASPFSLSVSNVQTELLQPAVEMTSAILEATRLYAPSIKRVVMTSSFAAVQDMAKGPRPGYTYTEKDWNPVTWEEAIASPPPAAYAASKLFAEATALEFFQNKKPEFGISWILPCMVYGPLLSMPKDAESLNTSTADIFRLMDGSSECPGETIVPAFVDVRDVAEAHLRAFESPETGRFLVSGGRFEYRDICQILAAEGPKKARVPNFSGTEKTDLFQVDNSRACKALRMKYRGLQQCVLDTAASLKPLFE